MYFILWHVCFKLNLVFRTEPTDINISEAVYHVFRTRTEHIWNPRKSWEVPKATSNILRCKKSNSNQNRILILLPTESLICTKNIVKLTYKLSKFYFFARLVNNVPFICKRNYDFVDVQSLRSIITLRYATPYLVSIFILCAR